MGSVLTLLAILIALPSMSITGKSGATETTDIDKGDAKKMKVTSVAREL